MIAVHARDAVADLSPLVSTTSALNPEPCSLVPTQAPYMRDEAFPHRQIGPIPRLFVESAFFTRLTDRERDEAVRNASRRLAAIRLAGKFSELPRGQYPTFDGHKPSG